MKTIQSKKIQILQRVSTFIMLFLLLTINTVFANDGVKNGEDSNKVIKHVINGDEKDQVKITTPSNKNFIKSDRDIQKSILHYFRELMNPKIDHPDMKLSDDEINELFFSSYHIEISDFDKVESDEVLNSFFFAYNLPLPSAYMMLSSDFHIDINFYLNNQFDFVYKNMVVKGDSSINMNFNNEVAE